MGEARFHPSFLVSREDRNRQLDEVDVPEDSSTIIGGSDTKEFSVLLFIIRVMLFQSSCLHIAEYNTFREWNDPCGCRHRARKQTYNK